MSTINTQFHIQSSSIAHDVYCAIKDRSSLRITRSGILIAIIIAVVLAYVLPANVVATGTNIFFGICAVVFLPVHLCALSWKRTTKKEQLQVLYVELLQVYFV